MWIDRDILKYWNEPTLPARLLIGPRQCGKTSFLRKMAAKTRQWISLDDAATREAAMSNPDSLLSSASSEWIIDEVQYAPPIFSAIKIRIDQWRLNGRQGAEPSFWLTGSNLILLDRNIKESLAGRVSYFKFSPLSVHELMQSEISFSPDVLFAKGGWPELYANPALSPQQYLNDYISTVVEKDVVLSAGIQKVREFTKAVRLLAGRTGQVLSLSNITQDAGIKHGTLSDWISALETMQIITLVQPFYPSHNDRIIRSPKLYFNDVALAVRLQGWNEMLPLITSPAVGAVFETLVFSEIYKASLLQGQNWAISYLRTKEGDEIDFVIEGPNLKKLCIEVKWSSIEASNWVPPARLMKLLGDIERVVVSFSGGPSLVPGVRHLSLSDLHEFLMSAF